MQTTEPAEANSFKKRKSDWADAQNDTPSNTKKGESPKIPDEAAEGRRSGADSFD